jgi:hypothetical protein
MLIILFLRTGQKDITDDEIRTANKKLKRNKIYGDDLIINELFIECKDVLSPYLTNLFNKIFKSGYFPKCWAKSCIKPVVLL